MSIELWLAFVLASAIMLSIPGPTVLTVLSYSIAHGRHASVPVVAGVGLGHSTALVVSLVGLGAVLSASAVLFTVIKFVGGLYLLHLGIRMLRAGIAAAEVTTGTAPDSRWRLFLNTYLVTASNPKSIVFFVAFLPQFVNYGAEVAQQLWLLGVTHIVMAVCIVSAYSALAASANRFLTSQPAQQRLNLAGGSLLSAAGVWALLARHSA